MPWIPRGLRDGIVTTRYPRRPDGYGPAFRGRIVVDPEHGRGPAIDVVREACPTDAISTADGQVELDRGRCILCGRCTDLFPETFRFEPNFETSAVGRTQLVVPDLYEDDAALAEAQAELGRRTKALRRSIHIRHVDAGSDGSEEWEVAALTNPIYDVQRLGIFFTASPKHADVLLVTGVGTTGMVGPLQRTFDVMPNPKVVIAAGVDAISGGLLGQGYASLGGVEGTVPVDVFVPGSPPSPFGLLHGILLAVGLLPGTSDRRGRSPVYVQRAAHGPTSHHHAEDPPREVGP
jgi:Ni,Fe-hydrogenase III small subunit/ferredoxin